MPAIRIARGSTLAEAAWVSFVSRLIQVINLEILINFYRIAGMARSHKNLQFFQLIQQRQGLSGR